MSSFTPEVLNAYLRERLGTGVRLIGLERYGRGSSRETWVAQLREGTGTRKIVLRRDPPAGAMIPTPLRNEYLLYDGLGQTDVPIAKAMWWEDGGPWADRPFYLREHVEGHWRVEGLENEGAEADVLRIEISKQHIAALARVHAVDWRALRFDELLPAPLGRNEAAAVNIDAIVARYQRARIDPVPIVLEAAAWLKARAPVASRISLCKGTNGLGEEVFRDGRLVALSDWEEASIGDPAADFAFMQNMAPRIVRDGHTLWSLQHALDYYATLTGTVIERESVRFYGWVRALWMATFSQTAAAGLHRDPQGSEIRQAWTATEINHLAQRILATAMGWLPPLPQSLFEATHRSIEQN